MMNRKFEDETNTKEHLKKNWKSQLITRISLANVGFPLLFLLINQVFVAEYLHSDFSKTFAQRALQTSDVAVYAFFLFFGGIALIVVLSMLRPLFTYLENGKLYTNARAAALKIPWFLILIHGILWVLAPTAFYKLLNLATDKRYMPFVWAVLTDLSTGLMATIFIILAINNALAEVKVFLGITEIRKNEKDYFIKYRDYIVTGVIVFYSVVHMAFLAYFYYNYGVIHGFEHISVTPAILWGVYLLLLALVMTYFSKRDYHFQIKNLKKKLNELSSGSINISERITLINFDEIGVVCAKINQFLATFTGILQKIKDATNLLLDSANSLSASSSEIASISNQQAAAVKEVVSTVEESDNSVNEMDQKINEVADLIKEDEEAINRGYTMIQESLDKMGNIKESNDKTIQGIKALGEQIETIWDIVRIINSIADQTKIIAFNAELEASAAGDAGKNFQIVAGEIRRLADKTVASTKEIKSKIDEIQRSNDFLVLSSEESTNKIKEEWELSSNIGKIFDNIRKSTEISTKSAEHIIFEIRQVVSASNQILLTLRQINEGIENFVESTTFTSESAQQLKNMAGSLSQVVDTYSI